MSPLHSNTTTNIKTQKANHELSFRFPSRIFSITKQKVTVNIITKVFFFIKKSFGCGRGGGFGGLDFDVASFDEVGNGGGGRRRGVERGDEVFKLQISRFNLLQFNPPEQYRKI